MNIFQQGFLFWGEYFITNSPTPPVNWSGVNKSPQKIIFAYLVFSQNLYLNMWCFEKIHICIPKIQNLHTLNLKFAYQTNLQTCFRFFYDIITLLPGCSLVQHMYRPKWTAPQNRHAFHKHLVNWHLQGVFFNWSYPKNYKFFSVSKMFRTFKLVPP